MDSSTTNLRMPPQSIEAEGALLGAVLSNNKAFDKVSEFLRPEHFSNALHGRLYGYCYKELMQGHAVDPVLIFPPFSEDEDLTPLGGAKYLISLVQGAVSIINVLDYGKLIYERAMRRQLIAVGTDLVNDAFALDLEQNAFSQLETAQRKLYELSTEGTADSGPQPFVTPLTKALKMIEAAKTNPSGISGVTSGFSMVDEYMGGFHSSDLVVLAGRPAMGKTALATCIAVNAAQRFQEENVKSEKKKSVAFFSLEMSAEQLAARILSMETHVNSHSMRTGKVTSAQLEQIMAAVSENERLPFYIDDTPGLTISAIRNRARRLKLDHSKGLGMVVIDYLQLINTSDLSRENRVQELSEITRSLKIMAKELEVPVIALSQLSRLVEQRDDKRPLLSDLRESGSIEQDADVVLFVFREIYYLENTKPVQRANELEQKFQERYKKWEHDLVALRNKAEFIIAKQRHGPTGKIPLFFDGEYTKFEPWPDSEQPL